MIFILLGQGFEEAEALVPADLLRRAGLEVLLVGVDSLQVTGGHGITVLADCLLRDVSADQADMVVLPGGLGGVYAIQSSLPAQSLIQGAYDRGIYLAAICAAPTILANLGILDRKGAVCYPGMEEEMGSAVVEKGTPVVHSGHIVTAEAAGSVFEFGLKLVEVLQGAQAAQEVRDAIHFHH
ncbi:DJ-1/PfpI family protein [Pseudoflavonifractor sp. 524-17]|uniref:DJ-1 family glyoxalase III n=1 Tax=Pseudoflavonifractor sp. 524-17 TaxID=2304577 RepID=UPI00137A5BBC|nr:DJ-1 family glyoxalase III [Pseudoflavonifractor sp. 524-17]NCE64844.1 DJ-1/PfpI family protein [Pseudoflavonifractor sp. 524-17]